jgi:hypothetical protein
MSAEKRTLKAGALYFCLVFAAGWVLGRSGWCRVSDALSG